MDSLPDHILRAALCMLPQVDVFRLRKVSLRLEDFLSDQLVSLVLDELELVLQFRERKLEYVSGTMLEQIVDNYGPGLVKLEVTLLDRMLKSFADTIAVSCPNLVELTLNQRPKRTYRSDYTGGFPMSSLLQLPNLKVLRANLVCRPNSTIPVETVIDRLLHMDEIKEFRFNDSRLQTVFRNRGVPMAAVKGVTLPSWIASDTGVFPSVESISIYDFPIPKVPEVLFFPSSLKKLAIVFRPNVRLPPSTELTAAQLEPLKRLVCLTEFILLESFERLRHRTFYSFDFLEYFTKLELLCMVRSKYFTADAFCFIPEAAPLRYVGLMDCPAVCKSVFNILSSRKGLQHLSVSRIDSRDDAESILQVLSSNVNTLRELALEMCSGVADSFLEQLCNRTILELTTLNLHGTDVTPAGILQLLRRRHQLIRTAREQNDTAIIDGEPMVKRLMPKDATGLAAPPSLLVISVDFDIARELSAEGQSAMVYFGH